VDLNTTGNVAVVADPITGRIWRFGGCVSDLSRRTLISRRHGIKHRGGIYSRFVGKSNNKFGRGFNGISKSVVFIAKELDRGIKLENLYKFEKYDKASSQIINRNWEFAELQIMIEKHAHRHGIGVLYVDPSYTSSMCCVCGGIGRRNKKLFRCLSCGLTVDSDVNAAFNISARGGVRSNIFGNKDRGVYENIDELSISSEFSNLPICDCGWDL